MTEHPLCTHLSRLIPEINPFTPDPTDTGTPPPFRRLDPTVLWTQNYVRDTETRPAKVEDSKVKGSTFTPERYELRHEILRNVETVEKKKTSESLRS